MNADRFNHAMTATEFMAVLAQDEDYQRRKRKADAEQERRSRELDAAEQPILEDLRGVGCDAISLWHMPESYPEALPVIMKHLERGGYPDVIMGRLGRLMGVRYAEKEYWDRLRVLYENHGDPDEDDTRQGLAVALGHSASKKHFDDLVELLRDDSRDDVRVLLIEPIIRIGRERGWEVIESVADDPVVGKEASYRLHQRELRRKAKARREARGY